MKFSKTLASVCAATVALSSLAVSAFAANITSNSAIDLASDGEANAVITLFGGEEDAPIDLFTEKNVARSDVYGMKVYFDLTADQVNGEEWIGGGIGANSDSTSWLSVEWGQAAGKKPIALAEDGTVTWLQETPVFADTDTYCQLWIQSWSMDLTIEKMEVLDKDGNAIAAFSDVEEDETPGEDTGDNETPDDETPGDDTTIGDSSGDVDEPTVGPTEDPEEPEDPVVGPTTDPEEPDDNNKPGDTTKPAEPDDPIVNPDDNNKPADDDNNKPADDNNKPADDNKNPASPDTGVTAAVLPAALAAASLAVAGIVLKKRK